MRSDGGCEPAHGEVVGVKRQSGGAVLWEQGRQWWWGDRCSRERRIEQRCRASICSLSQLLLTEVVLHGVSQTRGFLWKVSAVSNPEIFVSLSCVTP